MGHRGGKRPGAGRKKTERPTNPNVAQRVLTEARAEQTWLSMITLEKRRLGIGENGELIKVRGKVKEVQSSIMPLTNLLRYLEDRAYGRPVDTVNHLHDKPLELNVHLDLAERIAKARRKLQ